jgi:hypothetical protein
MAGDHTMNSTEHPSTTLEIQHLALENAGLREDNRALRETLRESVTMLHTLTEQNKRLRTCLRRDLWAIYGRVTEPKRRAA